MKFLWDLSPCIKNKVRYQLSSADITALFRTIAIFLKYYTCYHSTVECRANDSESMGDCKKGAAMVPFIMSLYLLIANVLLLNLLIAKFK